MIYRFNCTSHAQNYPMSKDIDILTVARTQGEGEGHTGEYMRFLPCRAKEKRRAGITLWRCWWVYTRTVKWMARCGQNRSITGGTPQLRNFSVPGTFDISIGCEPSLQELSSGDTSNSSGSRVCRRWEGPGRSTPRQGAAILTGNVSGVFRTRYVTAL